MLKCIKSINGITDYAVIKIIEDDSVELDQSHLMDNLSEYKIYIENFYVEKVMVITILLQKDK